MATPTPVFPASIATDAQLKVANNLVSTTLSVGIDGVNTILFVASAAGFVANGLVSIENEILWVTSVSTTPNQQLIVASGGRGYDGTVAVPHSAGVKVSMFIDAWHHNVLAAEVKAIEAFIGPHGQNIGSNYPYLVSGAFTFGPQSPGGSLIAGNNSITLSPVPAGVNGNDANHYLYISGGTGTPETVLITGGTAVPGSPSGMIIVNCANAHSGAWTIQSATAGIQEAVNSLPGAVGVVTVPAGIQTVYGPTTVSGNATVIQGGGRNATQLNTSYTAGPLFNFVNGNNNQLKGLTVLGAGTGSNYAVVLNSQNSFSMEDVNIAQVGGGIQILGSATFHVCIDNVNVSYFTLHGISIEDGGDHYLSRLMISGQSVSGTVGIFILQSGGTSIWASDIISCDTGLEMAPNNGQNARYIWITDSAFDSCMTTGIFITPAAGAIVRSVNLVNCWTCSSTGSGGPGIAGTGTVIGSTGTVDGIRFIGHRFLNNNTNGLVLFGGIHILLNACVLAGNGNGMLVQPGVGNWTVRSSQIGASDGFPNTQTYGISIASGASDNFAIESNSFLANVTGAIQNGATGTHNVIRNNLGYNPVGQSAITPGASPFTYTAGPSPEIVYIFGGTVSNVKLGTTQIAAASPAEVTLYPNQSVTVTYTAAPTMAKDVQ